MDTMGIVVCIGLLLLPISILLIFIAIASMKSQERAEKQIDIWQGIADRLGWTYDQKRKKINAVHRGRSLKIDQFEPGRSLLGVLLFMLGLRGGFAGQVEGQLGGRVRIRMGVTNPSEGYMSLVGKGSRTSIEKLMFGQIQTQIEEIDEQFTVESKPKDFAEKLLSSKQLRDQISGIHQMTRISLVIRKNELNLQAEGLKPIEGSIFMLTNLACDVTEAVDNVVV